jgi:secernin
MCDTVLAPPGSTAERTMLFGKNSDRQRNEAQAVEYFPSAEYSAGTTLRCTYVTVPQTRRTNAVLLSRPCWTWGAEMGANEHGVVIGNEGLHARGPAPEGAALTGMDLLRLALERASTAAEAVEVLTSLLQAHGQGGNCGHLEPRYYHNGYLIADPSEAFVVETFGREWVLERSQGVRALSNIYSIGSDAQRVSAGLEASVTAAGWTENPIRNFAEALNDPVRQHIGKGADRRTRATTLLQSRDGKLVPRDIMRILRDHGPPQSPENSWAPYSKHITLCLHATTEERIAQTVGAWVSELHARDAVHWVTASTAPCISIFKPLLMDVELPTGLTPLARFDAGTVWWRHEQLHRAAIFRDFCAIIDEIGPERDALEATFESRVHSVLNGGSSKDRSDIVRQCWKDAQQAEERWLSRVESMPLVSLDPAYRATWSRMNDLAGFHDFG